MTRIIITIGLLISAMILFAQESHNFGIQIASGYSDIIGLKETKSHGGGKIETGVLYELHKTHFIFQIGAGFDYSYHTIRNNTISDEIPDMIDTDNDVCIYHYSIDNKIDQMHRLAVIPRISVGGQWRSLYFLIGFGVQINLISHSITQAKISTSGEYAHLIVPLEAMENHYFVESYPLSNKRGVNNNINLSVHGEVGYQLPSNNHRSLRSVEPIHRIAVFVECGIVSLNNSKVIEPIVDLGLRSNRISDIDFERIAIQPLVGSDRLAWKDIHPISVGVRWTMILNFSSSDKCICIKD